MKKYLLFLPALFLGFSHVVGASGSDDMNPDLKKLSSVSRTLVSDSSDARSAKREALKGEIFASAIGAGFGKMAYLMCQYGVGQAEMNNTRRHCSELSIAVGILVRSLVVSEGAVDAIDRVVPTMIDRELNLRELSRSNKRNIIDIREAKYWAEKSEYTPETVRSFEAVREKCSGYEDCSFKASNSFLGKLLSGETEGSKRSLWLLTRSSIDPAPRYTKQLRVFYACKRPDGTSEAKDETFNEGEQVRISCRSDLSQLISKKRP
jgi:hypothetical protein